MPFSKQAKLIDRLRCGGNLAYSEQSIICCASGPKALLAHSFSSSRKSESDFVLGSKVSLCLLCFAVASDGGLKYFRWNMLGTSSNVRSLLALLFLENL